MTASGRNKPNIPSWARPVDDKLVTAKERGLMSPADKAKLDSLVPGVALTAADPLTILGGTIDIKAATPSQEGSLAAADKAKLDGLVAGAQVNVLEDVTLTSTTTALVVTGGGPGGIVAKVKALSLALATAVANGAAGLLSGADKAKLDGITALATPNLLESVSGTAPITAGAVTSKAQAIGITPATPSAAGSLSAADKTKLDAVAAGAEANVLEDVTLTSTTTAVAITGGGAGGIVGKVKTVAFTIANAVASGAAGLLTGADKAKLDAVAAGAEVNQLNAVTGTAPITAGAVTGKSQAVGITAATPSAAGSLSAADKTKLDAVAAGAEVNQLNSVTGTAPITAGAVTAKSQAVSITAATPTAAGSMSATDKAKLDSMGAGGAGVLYGTLGEVLLPDYTPHGGTTGGGVGRYTRPAGPQQDVHLRSGTAAGSYAMIEGQNGTFLAQNLYFDGTAWQRYDTAQQGLLFYLGSGSGGWAFGSCPAGANPVTAFTTRTLGNAQLDTLLGLGTYVRFQRSTNLAVPATTLTSLGTLTLPTLSSNATWLAQGWATITSPGAATFDVALNGATEYGTAGIPAAYQHTIHTPIGVIAQTAGTAPGFPLYVYGNGAGTALAVGGAAGSGVGCGFMAWRIA
jgi:hypothetical protein